MRISALCSYKELRKIGEERWVVSSPKIEDFGGGREGAGV
jgi:hypothetical protein